MWSKGGATLTHASTLQEEFGGSGSQQALTLRSSSITTINTRHSGFLWERNPLRPGSNITGDSSGNNIRLRPIEIVPPYRKLSSLSFQLHAGKMGIFFVFIFTVKSDSMPLRVLQNTSSSSKDIWGFPQMHNSKTQRRIWLSSALQVAVQLFGLGKMPLKKKKKKNNYEIQPEGRYLLGTFYNRLMRISRSREIERTRLVAACQKALTRVTQW